MLAVNKRQKRRKGKRQHRKQKTESQEEKVRWALFTDTTRVMITTQIITTRIVTTTRIMITTKMRQCESEDSSESQLPCNWPNCQRKYLHLVRIDHEPRAVLCLADVLAEMV